MSPAAQKLLISAGTLAITVLGGYFGKLAPAEKQGDDVTHLLVEVVGDLQDCRRDRETNVSMIAWGYGCQLEPCSWELPCTTPCFCAIPSGSVQGVCVPSRLE